jgi:hypothetical protein
MASQILGNILITFVLAAIGKVAYFIVLTALGGIHHFIQAVAHFYSFYSPTSKPTKMVDNFQLKDKQQR